MLIFLDIDGVLRRVGAPLDVIDEDCLERFEQVIRDHPDAQIVISSSWRLMFTVDDIRALFAPDIGQRIVGQTPWLEGRRGVRRFDEVLAYLAGVPKPMDWVAIDDDLTAYPEGAVGDYLILTDAKSGFDSEAAMRLHQAIEVHDEPNR